MRTIAADLTISGFLAAQHSSRPSGLVRRPVLTSRVVSVTLKGTSERVMQTAALETVPQHGRSRRTGARRSPRAASAVDRHDQLTPTVARRRRLRLVHRRSDPRSARGAGGIGCEPVLAGSATLEVPRRRRLASHVQGQVSLWGPAQRSADQDPVLARDQLSFPLQGTITSCLQPSLADWPLHPGSKAYHRVHSNGARSNAMIGSYAMRQGEPGF
jgi:hypothetical protein